MGIYTSGKIFGIKIYNFQDDISNTLFEEKYDEIMSIEQMKEVYLFYEQLNDKQNLFFKIYTECSSTLNMGKENYMEWYPINVDTFLENFAITK